MPPRIIRNVGLANLGTNSKSGFSRNQIIRRELAYAKDQISLF